MNNEVFFSLLAMDAYNRGFGSNINDLGETGQLGWASVREFEAGEQSGWQAAGFYAIAYDWNGQTVISYRGTNPDLSFASADAFLNSPLVKDIGNGGTLGAGFAGASPALH